eukprot:TRINITY_DN1356_c0_g1_i1.p1 TRINITY_DN1356_c0_g1~~TRINITY_DN1356_c0_g1_i1.p1  ORF type:complete len:243 (+),score=55.76 TRINITY_DN1356_c0_g1_i1:67-795(+)
MLTDEEKAKKEEERLLKSLGRSGSRRTSFSLSSGAKLGRTRSNTTTSVPTPQTTNPVNPPKAVTPRGNQTGLQTTPRSSAKAPTISPSPNTNTPKKTPPKDNFEIPVNFDDDEVRPVSFSQPKNTGYSKTSKDDIEIVPPSEVSGHDEDTIAELELARLNRFVNKKKDLTEEDILKIRQKQEEEFRAKQMKEKTEVRLREWEVKKAEEAWNKKQDDFHKSKDSNDTDKKKAAADKLTDLLGL